jgi:hypothetical protein
MNPQLFRSVLYCSFQPQQAFAFVSSSGRWHHGETKYTYRGVVRTAQDERGRATARRFLPTSPLRLAIVALMTVASDRFGAVRCDEETGEAKVEDADWQTERKGRLIKRPPCPDEICCEGRQ